MSADVEALLTPLEAAHHLGITTELLFCFTKRDFGKANGLRSLHTVQHDGQTRFSVMELDAFDSMLAGQWSSGAERRPNVPKAILDHLRAESQNQCARCRSGVGVDTAHIRPWTSTRSHHPDNLIRICSACHREHDSQHSLSTEQLQEIKNRLIARTRAGLQVRMQPSRNYLQSPRPCQDFVGRKNELELLVDALRLGRSVTVYGVGGIGKSELLLQALSQCGTGRPVLWCNIEQYRTVADVMSALRTALATDGTAISDKEFSSRLDDAQTCVVFDGIEQGSLDDFDAFEDTVNTLFHATTDTQFVSTSQIVLHRLPAELRMTLVGLGQSASRALLTQSCAGYCASIHGDPYALLGFCDGHTLTVKLAGALTEHYGSPTAALKAIQRQGMQSVNVPGRGRHTRQTSLDLCLQTAYEALADGSRQLLWALAQAPAGILTQYIDRKWIDLDDVSEALASLRKWHLVDVVPIDNENNRTRMLTPVRRFVIQRGSREEPKPFERIVLRVVHGFEMMVAVLELRYSAPEDTPYTLQRFGEELPNFLHVLKLAQERQENEGLLTAALSIVQCLMPYFFVLRLPEQGARVMYDAADLAFRTRRLEDASALATQYLALAHRTGDKSLVTKGLTMAREIAGISTNPEVLADVAMCEAMSAQGISEFPKAERYARQAFEGYQTLLLSLKAKQDTDGSLKFKREDLHNDVSHALSMLGFACLSQQRYGEAAKAYRHSLQHERGASIGVNRGQTLHQIGNCERNLGNHEAAAQLYIEATEIFHLIGMEEYLSNASGELGYTLLDADVPGVRDHLSDKIIDHVLADLKKDVARVFDPERPLEHQHCIGTIRKLFGNVILFSLTGYGVNLTRLCVEVGGESIKEIGVQIDTGARNRDDLFPILMIDVALRLGVLIAQCENDLRIKGDIVHDNVGTILRLICETHDWAQNTMRVIDWVAVYLARRLKFKGIDANRIRVFVRNYNDDVEDYLDLKR